MQDPRVVERASGDLWPGLRCRIQCLMRRMSQGQVLGRTWQDTDQGLRRSRQGSWCHCCCSRSTGYQACRKEAR